MSDKLAIHGGTPVRTKPWPSAWPGATVYDENEKRAVLEVLDARSPFRYYGFNVLGKVKEFEKNMCTKFGVKHTLAVTSCTASLIVALKAAGVGPGQKVIIPACTFIATAGAVVSAGAVPVFVDVDDSLNVDPEKIVDVVDDYTTALVVVPLLGNPCKMDRIVEVAKKLKLTVIEDVAQSQGSMYKGKYSGTYGDIGCFSLQMNKILSTGEGGMVVTNNDKLYERAVRYHDHGQFREVEGFLNANSEADIFIGQNYRMSEVTGAIAVEQLKKLDAIVAHMKKYKKIIKDGLQGVRGISFRTINDEEGDAGSCLVMLLPTAELATKFIEAVNAEGIGVGSLYGGRPVYTLPQLFNQRTPDKTGFPFTALKEPVHYKMGMCPVAEKIMPKNVMMYITPEVTDADAQEAITAFKKVAEAIL